MDRPSELIYQLQIPLNANNTADTQHAVRNTVIAPRPQTLTIPGSHLDLTTTWNYLPNTTNQLSTSAFHLTFNDMPTNSSPLFNNLNTSQRYYCSIGVQGPSASKIRLHDAGLVFCGAMIACQIFAIMGMCAACCKARKERRDGEKAAAEQGVSGFELAGMDGQKDQQTTGVIYGLDGATDQAGSSRVRR